VEKKWGDFTCFLADDSGERAGVSPLGSATQMSSTEWRVHGCQSGLNRQPTSQGGRKASKEYERPIPPPKHSASGPTRSSIIPLLRVLFLTRDARIVITPSSIAWKKIFIGSLGTQHSVGRLLCHSPSSLVSYAKFLCVCGLKGKPRGSNGARRCACHSFIH
jgi:hypothetical protein